MKLPKAERVAWKSGTRKDQLTGQPMRICPRNLLWAPVLKVVHNGAVVGL